MSTSNITTKKRGLKRRYVHYGPVAYCEAFFIEVSNGYGAKPHGGLWACDTETVFGWKQFCESECRGRIDEGGFDECFTFTLADDANVLHVYSTDDFLRHIGATLQNDGTFDWVGLKASGIDAIEIHVSKENALIPWGLHQGSICQEDEKLHVPSMELCGITSRFSPLRTWDFDSILILNKDIIEPVHDTDVYEVDSVPSPKFAFTGKSIEHEGRTLNQIYALRSFGNVVAGEIGGWIEFEGNLSHDGLCWVRDDAKVYDYAYVCEDASVECAAEVFDDAVIQSNAIVSGDSCVYNHALITDNAFVGVDAKVHGNARVCGDAIIDGLADVYGDVTISGSANITDCATVRGYTSISDDAIVSNNCLIYGVSKLYEKAVVDGDCIINGEVITSHYSSQN